MSSKKPKNSQERNRRLTVAGEFFVAAELLRRDVHASVTYGNAKAADIVCFSEADSTCVVVEVKSTDRASWRAATGKVPEASDKPWVFVHLNENHPAYYIVKQRVVSEIIEKDREAYFERYPTKDRAVKKGDVFNISPEQLKDHKDSWKVITDQLLRSSS